MVINNQNESGNNTKAKNKKQLFLHVGFGKTGSSAIQSWLANNVDQLAARGISYRVNDKNSVAYKISSGNGNILAAYLVGKLPVEVFFRHYFKHRHPKTIISSEILALNPKKIEKIKEFCKQYQIDVRVIAYVRDAFDHSYSKYVQFVKGRNYLHSFEHFLLHDLRNISHIQQAKLMNLHFDDIQFIHYNRHKHNLIQSMCDALGIDMCPNGEYRRKVNRSLSIDEIVIIQRFVSWRKQYINDLDSFRFSQLVSDWLVNNFHDRDSEMIVSQHLIDAFTDKFKGVIDRFNKAIGKKNGFTMNIYDFSRKNIVEKQHSDVNIEILREVSGFLSEKGDLLEKKCMLAFAKELKHIDKQSSQMFYAACRKN